MLNGYELLSGSIRIHDQKLQEKVFEAIGMTLEEAHEKFTGLWMHSNMELHLMEV